MKAHWQASSFFTEVSAAHHWHVDLDHWWMLSKGAKAAMIAHYIATGEMQSHEEWRNRPKKKAQGAGAESED